MELRQLEYFLMVSDLTSFTHAAERLYVSQPAVTNAVRTLEEELGIQLFDRSQRKVALTTEGKIFYRHIQNIMQGISNNTQRNQRSKISQPRSSRDRCNITRGHHVNEPHLGRIPLCLSKHQHQPYRKQCKRIGRASA